MAIVVSIVTRLDATGIGRAQKQLAAFAARAKADNASLAGAFLRTGATVSTLGRGTTALGKGLTRGVTMPALAATAAVGLLAKSTVSAYTEYSKSLGGIQRMTGMTMRATSLFAGQIQLLGIDMGKAQTGAGFLAKNLDKARTGAASQVDMFKRLGVSLKEQDGQWRSVGDVLGDTRERLSQIEDPAIRANAAITLFGRGGRDMMKWFMATPEAIDGFNKKLEDMGLVFSGKAGKTFADYIQKMRDLQTTMLAAKIAIGATFAPLLSKYMPQLTKAIVKHMPQIKAAVRGLVGLIARAVPVVVSFGEEFGKRLAAIARFFDGLSPKQKQFLMKLAAIAVVAGPVLVVLGKLTQGVGLFISSIGMMGAVTGGVIGPLAAFTNLMAAGVDPMTAFKFATAPAAQGIGALGKAMGIGSLATLGWIAVVIAVIAALVLLYMKCEWFRNAVNKVFHAVVKTFQFFYKAVATVIGWIIKHWRGLLDAFLLIAGPIGWVTIYVIHHFDQVKDKVASVLKWFGNLPGLKQAIGVARSVCRTIGNAFGDLVGWIHDHWAAILSTIGGFVNKIGGIINTAFGWTGLHVPDVNWGTESNVTNGAGGTGTRKKGDPSIALPGQGEDMRAVPRRAGDPITDAVSWFGGKAKDLVGYLAGILPEPPKMPGPLAGLLPALIKRIAAKIKELVGKVGIGSADVGGAGYGWASALAHKFGLAVTSTYRPGAITAAGYVSDHATYGRAADLAGPAAAMARLWAYVKATAGSWKQAIYQHQMVNHGSLGYYSPSDHFDHVHLARAGVGDDSRRAPAAAPSVTNVFEGCFFAQDFDTVIAEANQRGATKILGRRAREQGAWT